MATPFIRQNQVEHAEKGNGHYVSEASSCGFPPGQWPTVIELQTEARTQECIRLKQCFMHRSQRENEIISVKYESEDKATVLTIYND